MIIWNFLKNLYLYIKYYLLLQKIYKEEELISKLEFIFKTKFHIDWVGRIYSVLNPNISDNKFDTNKQIFEYNENGLINDTYIESWIMTQMNLMSNFIQTNNLFDILSYDIIKLDRYDNYLFIIKPILYNDLIKWSKRFGILILIFIIILILYITLI